MEVLRVVEVERLLGFVADHLEAHQEEGQEGAPLETSGKAGAYELQGVVYLHKVQN